MTRAVNKPAGTEARPFIVFVITACVVCVTLANQTFQTYANMDGDAFGLVCVFFIPVCSRILRLET
jgi:hypothetical protein